jgi:uncharacterized protein (DUF427 family)
MAAMAGRVEPAPRRVSATLGGEQIFVTSRASYVWESPYYPQYYIPYQDVDRRFLVDEQHERRLRLGSARRHGLRAGGQDRPGSAHVFGDDAAAAVAGAVRFDWDALDAWFEEDEEIFVHPRNPYVRVDAMRSHRHVRVQVEGQVLAESRDIAWSYTFPTRQLLPIAGLIAFYNERVDTYLDDVELARPHTHLVG